MKKALFSTLIIAGLITFGFADTIKYYSSPNGNNKINSINFSDVQNKGENYWAKSAIYQVTSLGIMNGIASNSFSPITKVTNEQAITTILNAMGKAKEVNDLKLLSTYWSDKYIKYAMNNGLITEKTVLRLADTNGNLESLKKKGAYIRDDVITRQEIAMLIAKAFSLSASTADESNKIEFIDEKQIDEDKKSYVEAVVQAGIMVGNNDGMFNPKSGLTRAELAQILKNCDEYVLANLGVVKRTGFVEKVSSDNILILDDTGADIEIGIAGGNVPTLRNNVLTGVLSLKPSDEIEYYTDVDKCVKFIRVTDANIYGSDEENQDKNEKQGIVLGNSPYFYEISIKDKNGNTGKYSYGKWTEIYKDGKLTSPSEIMQGDTVYLEFDNLGDLVVIRGITNTVISYATVTDINDTQVTVLLEDNSTKYYELEKIPVYRNGNEISIKDIKKGEYAKIYSSGSKVIKVEIVIDERTNEGIYKGYISEINKIQDRIIIRNPKKFENGKWVKVDSGFITFPMDKEMQISYEGVILGKEELGEKQVGKFAYIATRQDTQVIERIKAINIGTKESEEIIEGTIDSFSEKTSKLKINGKTIKPYVDESTIIITDNKITTTPSFNEDDKVYVIMVEEDDEYIAKVISTLEPEKKREVYAYFGKVKSIEEGNEVEIAVTSRFEDNDWIYGKKRTTTFNITADTRIFNEAEPLNFDEFNDSYIDKDICVVAYGDEAVVISVVALTENPHIIIGSVGKVDVDRFSIIDTETYDIPNEEWIEGVDEEVITSVNTAITKNGRYAKYNEIKKGQEAIVIKPDSLGSASVVMLTD